MQLFQEGVLQGLGVDAIPGTDRPKNLDGTMVGDIGFDPLGFSNWLNLNWAREAEIKHGRVAMLAATGMIVQDLVTIPGFDKEFSGAAMMKLHNLAVQQVFIYLIYSPFSHRNCLSSFSGSDAASKVLVKTLVSWKKLLNYLDASGSGTCSNFMSEPH